MTRWIGARAGSSNCRPSGCHRPITRRGTERLRRKRPLNNNGAYAARGISDVSNIETSHHIRVRVPFDNLDQDVRVEQIHGSIEFGRRRAEILPPGRFVFGQDFEERMIVRQSVRIVVPTVWRPLPRCLLGFPPARQRAAHGILLCRRQALHQSNNVQRRCTHEPKITPGRQNATGKSWEGEFLHEPNTLSGCRLTMACVF